MEDNKKFELNDEQLDNVAGGRTGMDFGTPATQATTVPINMTILLQPDPRPKEYENTNVNPEIVDRL